VYFVVGVFVLRFSCAASLQQNILTVIMLVPDWSEVQRHYKDWQKLPF
jgi:hypothetical protein